MIVIVPCSGALSINALRREVAMRLRAGGVKTASYQKGDETAKMTVSFCDTEVIPVFSRRKP